MKKYNARNISTLIFIFSALLLISSCKSKKTITTSGTLESKSQTQIVEDALNSEFKYNTLTTKGSIEIKMGSSSKKSTAVYSIIKDQIMQVSIRPLLGMEAFRITFTPDSVIILDRLKKQYLTESIKDSKLMANFDFNFYNLQALLTNMLFVPGKQEVQKEDYSRFNVSSTQDVYMLQTKDKGNLLYNFAVDASDRIVSTLIYNEKKNITLQWTYGDFINDNNRIYPTNMEAKVDISKKRLDVGISYNKLDIDKTLDINSTVPTSYTKVGFSELMGAYIKLK